MKNKRVREKIGFTLAELLIVVAIIAVLAAIAIPVFTSQLNKSKYQTDVANARSIYSELSADYLANAGKGQTTKISVTSGSYVTSLTVGDDNAAKSVTLTNGSEKNVYEFSGLGTVKISAGSSGNRPSVDVTPNDSSYGDPKSFGK